MPRPPHPSVAVSLRRAARVVAGALAGALLGACGDATPPTPPVPPPPAPASGARLPGVVVLCLDTLRADALALGSGRAVAMPRLEAFARESVAFADAVAPAAWTGPSVTTLLTGLDPDHTGVSGLYDRVGELAASVTTLPRRLVDAGFDAAAIVPGGWVDPSSRSLRACREVTLGLDADPEKLLAAWDRRRPKNKPFFLYLHSMGGHDPYRDRDPTRRAAPTGEDPAAAARTQGIVDRIRARPGSLEGEDARWVVEQIFGSETTRRRAGRTLDEEEVSILMGGIARWLDDAGERDPELPALGERLRAAYVAGLADADVLFGRILGAIEALRLPEGTLIVVFGDHGEAFGEHGTLIHGRRLDDELIRVPLLVRGASRLGPPRVVRGASGLVDVAPTLLDLAGLAVPPGLDGVSLARALGAGALPTRVLRGVEARRRHVGAIETVEGLETLRTVRGKVVLRRDPATRRILGATYVDLERDPGERAPVAVEVLPTPCALEPELVASARAAGLAVPCADGPR